MIKILNLKNKRTTIMIKNIPINLKDYILINIITQNFRGINIYFLRTNSNKYNSFLVFLLILLLVILFLIFIICLMEIYSLV